MNRLTNLMGPVFVRELVELSRKRRTYILRAAYCLALLLVIYLAWQGIAYGEPGEDGIGQMARVGSAAFHYIITLQLFIAHLVVPMLVVGAIAGERQRGTLDLLLIADLETEEILLGKLASRLVPAITLLFSTAPILILLSFFGGVSLAYLGSMVAWILGVMLFAATLALFYSVQLDWYSALLRTYHGLAFFILAELMGGPLLLPLGVLLLPIALALVASLCVYFFVRSIYHLQRDPLAQEAKPATTSTANQPASLPVTTIRTKPQQRRPRRETPLWRTELRLVAIFVGILFGGVLLIGFLTAMLALSIETGPTATSPFWAIAFLVLGLAAVSNPLITRRPGFFDDLMMTPLSNEELLRGLLAVNRPWVRWIGMGLGFLLILSLFKYPVGTIFIAGIGVLFSGFILLSGTLCSLAADRPAARLWPMVGLSAFLLVVPYWMPAPAPHLELLAQILMVLGLILLFLKPRPATATSLSVAFYVARLYLLVTWCVVVLPAAIVRSEARSELEPHNIWALMSPWFYLAHEDYVKGIGADFAGYRAPLYLVSLAIVCALTWRWSLANFDYLVGRAHRQKNELNSNHWHM
jgi:ABC-type transport system involved in multi-copper enzyme maturation permease subunit